VKFCETFCIKPLDCVLNVDKELVFELFVNIWIFGDTFYEHYEIVYGGFCYHSLRLSSWNHLNVDLYYL